MSRHELLRGLQMSMLWRRHLPVLLAVSCGVAFSVAVFFVVRWWESRDINAAFQSVAADRAFEVKNTFETEIGMLELFCAALMTDGKVEKDEFREILQPFHSHDKSIESVQWIPRVSNGQRREFELAAQHNGFPGYRITEPDKNGQMMPAKQRSEYFPIYFAYFAGSRPASKEIWGYDVGSEPTRLEALCQARDSGKLVASGRIRFVRDPTEAGGFLVCVPVLRKRQADEDPGGSPQVSDGFHSRGLPTERHAGRSAGAYETGRDRRGAIRRLRTRHRAPPGLPRLAPYAPTALRLSISMRSTMTKLRTIPLGSTSPDIPGPSLACRCPLSSPTGELSGPGAS